MTIAEQACARQKKILVAAISRQAAEHGLERWRRGLIAEAAAFLGMECVAISERYGREISNVFPAYVMARLAVMDELTTFIVIMKA